MLLLAWPGFAEDFEIKPDLSIAAFEIPHRIGFSSGSIEFLGGKIDLDPKEMKLKSVAATLDAESITLYDDERDPIIRSEEYFNTEKFPQIKIKSQKVSEKSLSAEVTLRDRTKKVDFDYLVWGISEDKSAEKRAYVTLYGVLHKDDFGFAYNVSDDEGRNLLGNDLHILLRMTGSTQ